MDYNETVAGLPPELVKADRGNALRSLAIAFIVLETFCVALRFWAKSIGGRRLTADDGLIIPAWIFAIGMCISTIVAIDYGGVGRHIEVVELLGPETLIVYGKVLAAQPFIYDMACVLPRLTLLTLFLQIFPKKPERVACYVLMGLIIAHGLSLLIVSAVSCVPFAKSWDKTLPGACIDVAAFYRWGTLPNVIFDCFMLALPLPAIWKLQASRNIKLGLTVTFLTGSLGMITAILRTYYFFTLAIFEDPTWTSAQIMTWTIVEPGMYVIAACLPCYRPLLRGASSTRSGGRASRTAGQTPSRFINSFVGRKRSFGVAQPLHSFDDDQTVQLKVTPRVVDQEPAGVYGGRRREEIGLYTV